MITDQEAVELVVGKLVDLGVNLIGEKWQSPFGITLMVHLEVSWGPFVWDYAEDEQVLYGKNSAIPEGSFLILTEIAKQRHEAAEILRLVCADVLAGDGKLPQYFRDKSVELLTGRVAAPKKTKVQNSASASYKFHIRDRAILKTLHDLKADFGFAPTRSRSSQNDNLSGSKIVGEAISIIWEAIEGVRPPYPSEDTIVGIWNKRLAFEQAYSDARAEVSSFTSGLTV
ncbi:MAG: hypothetical protein AAFX07_08255 [Pseudomonadota bacterium]